MKDEFAHQKLRAAQYQNIEGSFELASGGSMALMAISYWIIHAVSLNNPQSTDLLGWVPLLVFGAAGFLFDRLVNVFKARFTYPRTGFISPLRPHEPKGKTRLIIWLVVPVFSGLLLLLLFLNRSSLSQPDQLVVVDMMPVFGGLLFSGLWVIIGWKIALPRFYLIALVSLLASAALFLRGVGGWPGFALLFGATGVCLLLTGGVTLWNYLRNNPSSESTDER